MASVQYYVAKQAYVARELLENYTQPTKSTDCVFRKSQFVGRFPEPVAACELGGSAVGAVHAPHVSLRACWHGTSGANEGT